MLKSSILVMYLSNPKGGVSFLKNVEGQEKKISFKFPDIQDSNAIFSELEVFVEAIENKKNH